MSKNEKQIKVLIFEKGYRPKENYYGLLLASINNVHYQSKLIKNFFSESLDISALKIIDFDLLRFKKSKKNKIKNFYKNFLFLYNSDLVFGDFPILLRCFLFILNWKGNYICIPPGKITKAIGYFKEKKLPFLKILKNFIAYKFLKTQILACDELDKIYLSAAHGYPIESIIISPYPKHLWINNYQKNNSQLEAKILFAPTERKKGSPSPITKLLGNKKFIEKILKRGYKILYSHHIHDLNFTGEIDKKVEIFDGNWADIKIVVTDYSSIGADFLLAGGEMVIYFTNDKNEFLENYGNGPLFKFEIKNGFECQNQDQILNLLSINQLPTNSKKFVSYENFLRKIFNQIK